MSGTSKGGYRARQTLIRRYGPDYFKKIGSKGGKLSNNGGFASNKVGKDGLTGRQRAKLAGARGGRKRSRHIKIQNQKTKVKV